MTTTKNPTEFDYTTADLAEYLDTVVGLNIIYRNQMRRALRSEENEMPQLRTIYDTLVIRKEEEGVSLMREDFQKGFVTLFNANVTPEEAIRL